MKQFEYRFVVQEQTSAPVSLRFVATLGEYDLDSPSGAGATPAEALSDFVEMHGEQSLK